MTDLKDTAKNTSKGITKGAIGSKPFIFIADPGHGGWRNGKYQILKRGSKQYVFPEKGERKELRIYEGVNNRLILDKIIEFYFKEDRNFSIKDGRDLYGDYQADVSLPERVKLINEFYYKNKSFYNIVVISIHGNAGEGTGLEVWTSVGDTPADPLAEIMCKALIAEFPDQKFRPDTSDGDLDKESQFYILKHTKSPAMLTENFFMDRYEDAVFMTSEEGIERIAKAHLKGMEAIAKK